MTPIQFLIGHEGLLGDREPVALPSFSEECILLLDAVSNAIRKDPLSRAYSDVSTYGFWCRKSSTMQMKDRFRQKLSHVKVIGRGTVFHIAPSNVAVNYAYSLAAGLLTGNRNIVRAPSKDFEQVKIINRAYQMALEQYPDMKPYVVVLRYERDRQINDRLSSQCDVRVVWGGNLTIAELRKSPLPPRATEVLFADRYSLAVIDAVTYCAAADKDRIARDFYNDTYLTDQNACTSPRLVCWVGEKDAIIAAKKVFWDKLAAVAKEQYTFQEIQGVDKLTTLFLAATETNHLKMVKHDNLLVRVQLTENTGLPETIKEYRGSAGFFYEYDLEDMRELATFCNRRVQTIAYLGSPKMFDPLFRQGVTGVDRIVPVGRTMEFDLMWDGYDLTESFTRKVVLL